MNCEKDGCEWPPVSIVALTMDQDVMPARCQERCIYNCFYVLGQITPDAIAGGHCDARAILTGEINEVLGGSNGFEQIAAVAVVGDGSRQLHLRTREHLVWYNCQVVGIGAISCHIRCAGDLVGIEK